MVAAMSKHFEKRLYPAVDAADKESCRPDFAVALCPGHLAARQTDFALNPAIHVTNHAPLRKAGVPAEMRVYVKGGHAFGLRRTESPITGWPQLVETWLGTIEMISR